MSISEFWNAFKMEVLLVLIMNAYLIGGIIIAYFVRQSFKEDKDKDKKFNVSKICDFFNISNKYVKKK